MNTEQTVFDPTVPIEVKFLTGGGERTVRVRFPSDLELIEWKKNRKLYTKGLGRGQSETSAPETEEVDNELFQKIKAADCDAQLDAYDAAKVIDRITQSDIIDVGRAEGNFKVTLAVPGAITEHLLEIPSVRQSVQFRRAFVKTVELRFNRQQHTFHLEPGAELYDKLMKSAKGYAVGVAPSILHKNVVVGAVLDAVDELELGHPVNF